MNGVVGRTNSVSVLWCDSSSNGAVCHSKLEDGRSSERSGGLAPAASLSVDSRCSETQVPENGRSSEPSGGPPRAASFSDERKFVGSRRTLQAVDLRRARPSVYHRALTTQTSETLPRRKLQALNVRSARLSVHPRALVTRTSETLPRKRLQALNLRRARSSVLPPAPATWTIETLPRRRSQAMDLRRARSSVHPRAWNDRRPRWRRSRSRGRRRKRSYAVLARRFVSASSPQARLRVGGGALRARLRANHKTHPAAGTPATAP